MSTTKIEQNSESHKSPEHESVGRDVVLSISDEELRIYDQLGPEDSTVKKWLAENGIGKNDRIVVNNTVYIAKPGDFLTRDLAATQERTLAAARTIVDLEAAVDKHTDAIAEHEPGISEELADDVGEVALDAAEVEEPDSEITGPLKANELQQSIEAAGPYVYLKDALPPVVRPSDEHDEGESKYDFLFADDATYNAKMQEFGQYVPETEEDKQRAYYDKYVTEENRQSSLESLVLSYRANPQLRTILEKHGVSPDTVEAVDAIRENAAVRLDVAVVLARKLDRMAIPDSDFGWRVVENSRGNLKVDPLTGKRMDSRTYAVGMALKMLDGEFVEGLDKPSDYLYEDDGRVKMGQHRHAARAILMSS
ncbi:TPA: hypothetical protein DD425_02425 [Candidatus Saccharibacteria bacterium]|nr:hypothetical protein [Candidatus Saccharibacteria bacterium]|tara:strand:- start:865 stop:1962 length:1098 start_codon:yes stop_codon:yes gene_type:complete